jgi:hypothetical protein
MYRVIGIKRLVYVNMFRYYMYDMENDNINILEHDINKNNDVSEKTV